MRDLMAEANEVFYEWEKEKYGDNPCNSDLSDDDRHVFVQGYVNGCMREHQRLTAQVQQIAKELREESNHD